MKSLYIASSHSFQEQPQLERPIAKDSDLHAFKIDDFFHRVGEYEMHLQQLRLIPCRPGDKWEEGVLYEEGKDYVAGMCNCKLGTDCPFHPGKWRSPCQVITPIASSPIK